MRTTFLDENAANTITIKYIVVNAPSFYNLLLGRPSLNTSGVVVSTSHLKLKLPSPEGKVDEDLRDRASLELAQPS